MRFAFPRSMTHPSLTAQAQINHSIVRLASHGIIKAQLDSNDALHISPSPTSLPRTRPLAAFPSKPSSYSASTPYIHSRPIPALHFCIFTRIHQPLLDVARERVKRLLDIDVGFRADFEERDAKFVGERLALLR